MWSLPISGPWTRPSRWPRQQKYPGRPFPGQMRRWRPWCWHVNRWKQKCPPAGSNPCRWRGVCQSRHWYRKSLHCFRVHIAGKNAGWQHISDRNRPGCNRRWNKFFRDLCTLEEMTDLTDRWQMVKYIVKGQSYRNISKKLKVSTTTVARVANWLNQGKGGYKLIVKRLKLK